MRSIKSALLLSFLLFLLVTLPACRENTPKIPDPTPTIVIPSMAPFTPQLQTSPIDGMVMVFVPTGDFYMGTDTYQPMGMGPLHKVYLDAFWIDQTEVTNVQYELCVQAGACEAALFTEEWITSDSQPVVGIDWDNAVAYCAWAGRQLPTEAQWEKAARGTDARLYPWGNAPAESCDIEAMDNENGHGCGTGNALPVGSKPDGASPYGALDMLGNAWEWVGDWYTEGYDLQNLQNPIGPETGAERVIRGGGWYFRPEAIQVSYRASNPPGEKHDTIGFRCALPVK